jgi:DNA-binding NarL/FixJ family response regulator
MAVEQGVVEQAAAPHGAVEHDAVTRVAVMNDYEVVVLGVLGLLAPFEDRVRVVELDVDLPVSEPVDVALYDAFSMEGTHSLALDDIIANPMIERLVLYTWNLGGDMVEEALARGVRGILAKGLPAVELVDALRRVHAGEVVVSPVPVDEQPLVPGDWPGRSHGLTAREAEVVALITQGLSNADIAARCYLSINSVKSYIRSAYRTMGVSTRSQAVRWGIEHGVDSTPTRMSVGPGGRVTRTSVSAADAVPARG